MLWFDPFPRQSLKTSAISVAKLRLRDFIQDKQEELGDVKKGASENQRTAFSSRGKPCFFHRPVSFTERPH